MTEICLQPFSSRGEIIVIEGQLRLVPMQLLKLPSNETVLRIGSSTYWFDTDGKYTGAEAKFPSAAPVKPFPEAMELVQKAAMENCNKLPDRAYFERGTPEYERERIPPRTTKEE